MSSSANISTYYVKLREMSFDVKDVGPHVSAMDLGKLNSIQVVDLLKKVAFIEPDRLAAANPHVLIYGNRGSYTVRPNRGSLRLQPTGRSDVPPVEMIAEAVPGWLDESEVKPTLITGSVRTPTSPAKRYLVAGILAASLCTLGYSIYQTYRLHPVISEKAFAPIASKVQLERLTQQVVGRYVNPGKNTYLLVSADGHLTCIEVSANGTTQDETQDTYDLADMTGRGPVIRGYRLGVIFIPDADTLVFNGENFTRKSS